MSWRFYYLPRDGHGVRMSTGNTWKPKRKGTGKCVAHEGTRVKGISEACQHGRHYQCHSLSCQCDCRHY